MVHNPVCGALVRIKKVPAKYEGELCVGDIGTIVDVYDSGLSMTLQINEKYNTRSRTGVWYVSARHVEPPYYLIKEKKGELNMAPTNKATTATSSISATIYNVLNQPNKDKVVKDYFAIKKVIFNNPATIVYWEDGTKTIVKRQKGDRWDKEKGLAMAFTKKALGNKGNYCNKFKKWMEE